MVLLLVLLRGVAMRNTMSNTVLRNGLSFTMGTGVLLGCFGRNIDCDSWFTWWLNHLPGPTIYPKRTPMIMGA